MKRLLREQTLTLNTALDIIRAAETTSDQLKKIEGEVETSVSAVKNNGKKPELRQKSKACRKVQILWNCSYRATVSSIW